MENKIKELGLNINSETYQKDKKAVFELVNKYFSETEKWKSLLKHSVVMLSLVSIVFAYASIKFGIVSVASLTLIVFLIASILFFIKCFGMYSYKKKFFAIFFMGYTMKFSENEGSEKFGERIMKTLCSKQ